MRTIHLTYFVHGTTADNEKEISSGWKDVGLSKLGKEQSIKLIDQIKNKKFDVVFCSDLKRAVESAEITFNGEVQIIKDKRLRECNYGKFNGCKSEIVEPMQEKCIFERFQDGESYEDVKTRIKEFIDFLKENYEGKSVAIIAHKAPQLALDVLLKGKTWKQAFLEDWRKKGKWQPGWNYEIEEGIDEKDLKKLVQEIVKKSKDLKDKHTSEKDAKVNYACIFCQSNEQFKEIIGLAKKLGKIIEETPKGPLFHIKSLETTSGKLQLLKIRKPDVKRPELGDADFTVSNYPEFKKKYLSKKGFKIIIREKFEMIELIDPEFNALAYFSNPPLDEQFGFS